jgi:ribosome-binding protein aMBF1 (putative translation factor)
MKKIDKLINQIKLYQLNDKAVTESYSDLDLANRIVLQLYQIRQKYGYSQQEFADRVGTTQSVIARMELKKTIPSLTFLNKVAKALKMELKIELVPIQTNRKIDMH